ncbi:hypothetical protein CMI42_04350 [Candidatus Pacearchaeota archaeon]|nr:hypothetical protein [Candidatus Pacearchaeota archaeon]|tara:strand:+ start:225 stop:563 length:339 start_codon:yes stop_codon:yes gene_type:complete
MPKTKKENKNQKNNDKKLKAFIASFFTIIGFIIAIVAWKEDKYTIFYAKHGLILFLGQIVMWLLIPLPLLGWFIPLVWILWVVLWVITWINALSGKQKRTFIITDLADKIDL